MHDVANSDVEGECVDAPEYNENMCGFTNRPGCIPLNGCGTTAIYFYLYSFVIVISLVLMNMFVAILHQGSSEVIFLHAQALRIHNGLAVVLHGKHASRHL